MTLEPKTRRMNVSRRRAACPACGTSSKRHSDGKRTLRDAGIIRPAILEIVFSKHYCPACRRHFTIPLDHIAPPHGHYTNRVRMLARTLDGMTLSAASELLRRRYRVDVPSTTLHDWRAEAIV